MNKSEKIYLIGALVILALLWHGISARTTGYREGYKEGMQDGAEKGKVECMCLQSNWYYNIGRILENEVIKTEAINNLKRCKEWGKIKDK